MLDDSTSSLKMLKITTAIYSIYHLPPKQDIHCIDDTLPYAR
jgi:hypothetical protein